MAEYISRGVFRLKTPVKIESYASVVGDKEAHGPLGKCFDKAIKDTFSRHLRSLLDNGGGTDNILAPD